MQFTPEQLSEMRLLFNMPGWKLLTTYAQDRMVDAQAEISDRKKSIDDIRVGQGRIIEIQHIIDLEDDLFTREGGYDMPSTVEKDL